MASRLKTASFLSTSLAKTSAAKFSDDYTCSQIAKYGTSSWEHHTIHVQAKKSGREDVFLKEYRIAKRVFTQANAFGCESVENWCRASNQLVNVVQVKSIDGNGNAPETEVKSSDGNGKAPETETNWCLVHMGSCDSNQPKGILPMKLIEKHFRLKRCLRSAMEWTTSREKSDDCLYFARAALYAIRPLAEFFLLFTDDEQSISMKVFDDIKYFAPLVLDRFGSSHFLARDRVLLMHYFAELLRTFYEDTPDLGTSDATQFGGSSSLRELSTFVGGTVTCNTRQPLRKEKKALNKVLGVVPFIVIPLLFVRDGDYEGRVSSLVHVAGESMKDLLPMVWALRRDYALPASSVGALWKILPAWRRPECGSYPDIAAFSSKMTLWGSLYLQPQYAAPRNAHLLSAEDLESNNEFSVTRDLAQWNMVSMADGKWIDSFYNRCFPGVDLQALFKAFRRPDLLLRYAMSNQQHADVITVLQEWVKAVVQDINDDMTGKVGGAVMKLRAGQKQNKRHLDELRRLGANVDAWINAPELERDPELLLHLGEVVQSCQAITGSLQTLSSSLTSYLAVGHIGALVYANGNACEPLRHGARTCENLEARAIIRFLIGSGPGIVDSRVPVLLLESPYKGIRVRGDSERSKLAAWHVMSKALALCHKLSTDLFIQPESQFAESWMKYLDGTGIGFDQEEHRWSFESVDGFSPYTYSDAFGGQRNLKDINVISKIGIIKHKHCMTYETKLKEQIAGGREAYAVARGGIRK